MHNPTEPHDAAELDDLAAAELELEASILHDSLRDFAEATYPLVANVPLRHNHATDGLIAAMDAVARGHVRRMLIEIGPGLSKSTLKTIYAVWRKARNASHRAIHASHAFDLAARDSRRARRLVESAWFRARFPHVQISRDEAAVQRWTTTQNGSYQAIGIGGGLTGHRANEAVVDDVLNALDAHSKAVRDEAYVWFTEGLLTRLDLDFAGADGSVMVIGQRLGTDDLAGRLRETGAWTVVTLAAEFDPRRRCVLVSLDGTELWRDGRTEPGELAAPDVLPRAKLDELRVSIGSAAYASQYNQDPASDETSMCPARWWRFYRASHAPTGIRRPVGCVDAAAFPAVELPPKFDRVVIAADLSFGSATGDYAVVMAWAAHAGGRYLLDMWRARAGFEASLAAIERMAAAHPHGKVVVEKAAHGVAVIETLSKKIGRVVPQVPVGAKAQRLASVLPQIEGGGCYLPEHAPWVDDVVDEFRAFPGRHDDIVDASVWSLLALTGPAVSTRERWTVLGDGQSGAQMARAAAIEAAQVEVMRAKQTGHADRMRDLDERAQRGEKLGHVDRFRLKQWRAKQAKAGEIQ